MIERDIDQLLAAIKNGDEQAVADLYGQLRVPFYNFARKYGLSHSDAEDVVQETFLKVFRPHSLSSYNSEKGSGPSWIWTIHRHTITDRLRKRALPTVDLEEAMLPPGPEILNPQERYIANESKRCQYEAWDSLSEAYKEAILAGRGRGSGRKSWHQAIERYQTLVAECENRTSRSSDI